MTGKLENIDLTPDQRKEVRGLLQRHLPDTEIWAYGSRVKFSSIPSSDLDLVVFASPEQSRAVSELKEAFDESYLPFQVDLFVWDKLPKTFHKSIMEAWMVLQEKKKGKLPRGWKEVSIGEIADVVGGGTPSSKVDKYWNGTIPWITPKDLSGYTYRRIGGGKRNISSLGLKESSAQLLPRNTVLVTSRAPIGYVALADGEVTTSQGFKNLILNTGYDPEFFYYLIKHNVPKLKAMSSGSTFGEISGNSMKQIRLKVPPFSEQRRIAGILGSLDDKIELNRRMSETLEAMSQAIFKSWFIDFDPVIDNALVAGNEIPEALQARAKVRQAMGDKRQPLPSATQSLFPAEFELTSQGPVPKGWKITTVGEVIRIIGGKTPSTKNESYWSNGIHAFCTPRDMSKLSTTMLLDTERSITDDAINSTNSELLPAGTALMSSRAPIGHLAITDIPVIINQGIIAFERQDKFSEMYLLSWIIFNMEKILEKANGSVFLEINKQNFRSISFLLPADKILDSFNRQVNTMQTRLASCARNMKKLSGTRDALLPKLISQIY